MTATQERAVNELRAMFNAQAERSNAAASSERTHKRYEFDVKPTDYGKVWVTVRETYPNAEGTLLSALSEHWFICVGKRGGKVAHIHPRSVEQFAGSRWCGIAIARADKVAA
jgi:hypothetical protein